MMHQSINKNKLYLYLFFLIFLSSIFNFQFLENFQNKFNIKVIKIDGLSYEEKKIVEKELSTFLGISIFKLREDEVLKKLNKFSFIERIHIKKIIPSSININLSKTIIVAKTLINGEYFYIGKNKKFIKYNQLSVINKIPSVYGDFEIDKFLDFQNILKNHLVDIKKIEEYYYYKNKRWNLQFSDGSTLMLPANNVIASVKIYKTLLDNGNLLNTKIIDLRVSNQIILTNFNE